MIEHKTNPVIAQANSIILTGGFETFEIGNLLERRCGFDLFDHAVDSPQQR